MGQYRESRNIEASLVDHLNTKLTQDGWTGINVYKVFTQVDRDNLPAIVVNIDTEESTRFEIGSKKYLNYYNIYIRIFAENDGNRLDLTDWMLDLLRCDIPYFEYTISNGEVTNKQQNGMVTILKISRNEREFMNTEILDREDRYRQLIVIQCYIAKPL
jgi:hypothetical protein